MHTHAPTASRKARIPTPNAGLYDTHTPVRPVPKSKNLEAAGSLGSKDSLPSPPFVPQQRILPTSFSNAQACSGASLSPIDLGASNSTIVDIACNRNSTCAVFANGQIKCWGDVCYTREHIHTQNAHATHAQQMRNRHETRTKHTQPPHTAYTDTLTQHSYGRVDMDN